MSLLTNYRRQAPFTIDQLLDAANAILKSGGAAPVVKRTLRFYTSQKVVPKPMGSPKFARYGYDHLLVLLAARALQDQGQKLHQIADEVDEVRRGSYARLERLVEDWLNQRNPTTVVRETQAVYEAIGSDTQTLGQIVRQFPLTDHAALSVSGKTELRTELEAARAALDELIRRLD